MKKETLYTYPEGPYMSYTKHDGADFIDSISQYEKDLKTIIKYNQYQ